MAARFIVIYSAILVLAQGSNLLPIAQEAEVPIHSGAPVAIISQGHPSVSQSVSPAYGHGQLQVPVSVGGAHHGVGIGLAGAQPYVAAPRPAVSYARPAAVVVPAVVVAPAAPIRQPHRLPAPVVVGAGHGNGYYGRHHG